MARQIVDPSGESFVILINGYDVPVKLPFKHLHVFYCCYLLLVMEENSIFVIDGAFRRLIITGIVSKNKWPLLFHI